MRNHYLCINMVTNKILIFKLWTSILALWEALIDFMRRGPNLRQSSHNVTFMSINMDFGNGMNSLIFDLQQTLFRPTSHIVKFNVKR